MHITRLAALISLSAALAACGETSSLQVSDGTGPRPELPPPNKTLLPTVNIAPAVGWPEGAKPVAAPGTQVAVFARELHHPRWLYVLPNGDVLVAETDAPPKPDDSKGIKGWIAKKVMSRAGSGVPSPNRITLLRDKDGDGVAETRSTFLSNLNSPFGMVLVGDDLYVADTDQLLHFKYAQGASSITTPGDKIVDLPGGTINHHWTKNVIASQDGKKLYVTVGSNSNVAENGLEAEKGRGFSPPACATPTAWPGSPGPVPCGLRSTSVTRSAATWCRTTSPRSRTAPFMAGPSAITGSMWTSA
jgi:glucose/arabinose dehydrogenase